MDSKLLDMFLACLIFVSQHFLVLPRNMFWLPVVYHYILIYFSKPDIFIFKTYLWFRI